MVLQYVDLEAIPKTHERLRQTFLSGKLRDIAYRKQQLTLLAYMIKDNRESIQRALYEDLHVPAMEADLYQINVSLQQIDIAIRNLRNWSKPQRAEFTWSTFAMQPTTMKEPRGVILVFGPYNYPFFLLINPVIGAIAAGNAVVMKPSEQSSATAALLAELVTKYLDNDAYCVVNGAVAESTKLLELKWDYIFFTGSAAIGRIIATAAAKHLTPVALELGGKGPVIVDPDFDMQTAAKRILWGKTLNCGQTCVAPEYILIPRSGKEKIVKALIKAYHEFYPEGAFKSSSYSRMATIKHFTHTKSLLDKTRGTIILGGDTNEEDLFIEPTIVDNVLPDDPIMDPDLEIFGPLLPIVEIESLDDAITFINSQNREPLALHVFTNNSKYKKEVFNRTRSGGVVVNDFFFQYGVNVLPFEGVGQSGYGAYMGRYTFDLFTHLRGTVDSPTWLDWLLKTRYPPYTDAKRNIFAWMQWVQLPSRPKMLSG